MTVGTVLDQISTRLAIRRPDIYESNPVTVALMEGKMWLLTDILFLVTPILAINLLIYGLEKREPSIHLMRIYMYCYGIVRLTAGLLNLRWLF